MVRCGKALRARERSFGRPRRLKKPAQVWSLSTSEGWEARGGMPSTVAEARVVTGKRASDAISLSYSTCIFCKFEDQRNFVCKSSNILAVSAEHVGVDIRHRA